jgi:hypothetical protein
MNKVLVTGDEVVHLVSHEYSLNYLKCSGDALEMLQPT